MFIQQKKNLQMHACTRTPIPLLTRVAHWECFQPLEAVAAVTLRLWLETLSLIQHEAVCNRCSLHSVYLQPTGKKAFNLHSHALPQRWGFNMLRLLSWMSGTWKVHVWAGEFRKGLSTWQTRHSGRQRREMQQWCNLKTGKVKKIKNKMQIRHET